MYCANCGVKLADTENNCPLCGCPAYHPDITRKKADPLYADQHSHTNYQVNSRVAHIVLTTIFLIPMLVVMLIDIQLHHAITWSGFAAGGILLAYIVAVLPTWFKRPNPLVFVPIDFTFVVLYLLYIDLAVEGDWFLSFAFPVTTGVGIIVTALIALLRYIHKGKLYIIGGTSILLGLLRPIIELLIYITFDLSRFIGWCIYPALVLVVLGGMCIFLAINRSAREKMERKFFI